MTLADKEEVIHSDNVGHGVSEDLSLGQQAGLEHLQWEQSRHENITVGKYPIHHRPSYFLVPPVLREISSVMMTAGRFLSPCRDGKLILGRGGVLRHLLAWRHLDVLHVLLQVGEVDADVVKGEIAFENICNTILSLRHCQLCI